MSKIPMHSYLSELDLHEKSHEEAKISLQYFGGFMLDLKMSRRELRTHLKNIRPQIMDTKSRIIELVVSESTIKVMERINVDDISPHELKVFENSNVSFCAKCIIENESGEQSESMNFLAILYIVEECNMVFLFSGPSEDVDEASDAVEFVIKKSEDDRSSDDFVSVDLSYLVSLEIMELDASNNFTPVPRNTTFFKVRSDTILQFHIKVRPETFDKALNLDFVSCTNFFLALSKDKPSTEKTWEFSSMDLQVNPAVPGSCLIIGNWRLNSECYERIKELSNGTFSLLSIVFNLKTQQFVDEIPFGITYGLKVYPETESFWNLDRPKVTFNFYIKLRKYDENFVNNKNNEKKFQYFGIYKATTSSLYEKIGNLFDHFTLSKSVVHQKLLVDPKESNDIIPGTGEVVESLSDNIKTEWTFAISQWKHNKKPSFKMRKLLQKPIPNEYRKLVWPLLAGIHDQCHLAKFYEDLLIKTSEYEVIIRKDLSRTFPLHPFFNASHSSGQSALYNVCKAYSLYDEDVGYVQGMSFIFAVLLLHVSEVNAFIIFVYLMENLNHRENFQNNFYHLHSKYFTIQKLLHFYLPSLAERMEEVSFHPHMFITNWFLTIFSCKFSLNFVYTVMDFYLQKGEIFIYEVTMFLIMDNDVSLNSTFDQLYQLVCCDFQKKYLIQKNVLSFFKRLEKFHISPTLIREYIHQYEELLHYQIDSIQDPVHLHKIKNRVLLQACARMDHINSQIQHKHEQCREDLIEVTHEYEENLGTFQLKSEEKIKKLEHSLKEFNERLVSKQIEITMLQNENSEIRKLYEQFKKECDESSHTLLALEIQRDSIQNIREQEKADFEKIINQCVKCLVKYRKMIDGGAKILTDPGDDVTISTPENSEPHDSTQDHSLEDLQYQLLHAKMDLIEFRAQAEHLEEMNRKLEEKLQKYHDISSGAGNNSSTSTSGWNLKQRFSFKK